MVHRLATWHMPTYPLLACYPFAIYTILLLIVHINVKIRINLHPTLLTAFNDHHNMLHITSVMPKLLTPHLASTDIICVSWHWEWMLCKARGCWYYHIVMSHEPNNRKLLLSWFQLWSNKLNCLMTWWWLKQSETYSIYAMMSGHSVLKVGHSQKSVQFSNGLEAWPSLFWGCRLCCLYNLGHPLLHCWVLLIMASNNMNQNMMEELMMAKSIGWVFYSSNYMVEFPLQHGICMIFKVLDVTWRIKRLR